MDDASENEDIVFVPMTTPNAEQEKSIQLNASNDVVLEMSSSNGAIGLAAPTSSNPSSSAAATASTASTAFGHSGPMNRKKTLLNQVHISNVNLDDVP